MLSINMEKAFELSKEFFALDTPSVSDALDSLGIMGGLENIKPINLGSKMCGPAFTLRYMPKGTTTFSGAGDYIDDVPEGSVIVIDNVGKKNSTAWGDILTRVAVRNKLGGTLIHGVCRDVPAIRELNYPLFSLGCYMVTGKDRMALEAINIDINVCEVRVRPSDIILGDDSGALVIPLERAQEVLQLAKEIEEKESGILKCIEEGMTLKDARIKYNYDALQRRKK